MPLYSAAYMSYLMHISELWPPVAMTDPAALILGIGSALTLIVASGMLEVVTRLFITEKSFLLMFLYII